MTDSMSVLAKRANHAYNDRPGFSGCTVESEQPLVVAFDFTSAEAAARAAVARARAQTGEQLELSLDGQFARGSVLRAHVRGEVALASLPLFGSIGSVEVNGRAAAPVDRYRSLLTSPTP